MGGGSEERRVTVRHLLVDLERLRCYSCWLLESMVSLPARKEGWEGGE